jgi:hypothetical protein
MWKGECKMQKANCKMKIRAMNKGGNTKVEAVKYERKV